MADLLDVVDFAIAEADGRLALPHEAKLDSREEALVHMHFGYYAAESAMKAITPRPGPPPRPS